MRYWDEDPNAFDDDPDDDYGLYGDGVPWEVRDAWDAEEESFIFALEKVGI
jgi:hypothetical protein